MRPGFFNPPDPPSWDPPEPPSDCPWCGAPNEAGGEYLDGEFYTCGDEECHREWRAKMARLDAEDRENDRSTDVAEAEFLAECERNPLPLEKP